MTIFIIWNKEDDSLFRDRYFTLTGEHVQRYPMESETQYMVGSQRITEDALHILMGAFDIQTDAAEFAGLEEEPV